MNARTIIVLPHTPAKLQRVAIIRVDVESAECGEALFLCRHCETQGHKLDITRIEGIRNMYKIGENIWRHALLKCSPDDAHLGPRQGISPKKTE